MGRSRTKCHDSITDMSDITCSFSWHCWLFTTLECFCLHVYLSASGLVLLHGYRDAMNMTMTCRLANGSRGGVWHRLLTIWLQCGTLFWKSFLNSKYLGNDLTMILKKRQFLQILTGFHKHWQSQGGVSIRKTVLPGMAIPMLKIRRPNGRLIFNMEIAIRR